MGNDYENLRKNFSVTSVKNLVRKTEWGNTEYKVCVRFEFVKTILMIAGNFAIGCIRMTSEMILL